MEINGCTWICAVSSPVVKSFKDQKKWLRELEEIENSSRSVILVRIGIVVVLYTPGIYAAGYIVFALTFVRSSVRMFVR